MKLSMDLEQAISVATDAMKAGFEVQVTPCTYNPNEYRVKAGGIDVVPTETITIEEEATCLGYTMLWGRDANGVYYVKFHIDGATVTYENESRPWSEAEVEHMEIKFCNDYGLQKKALCLDLDWRPWPSGDSFHKVKGSEEPRIDIRKLRTCHFGCGRVLKDHEKHCPDCVASGDEMYMEVTRP